MNNTSIIRILFFTLLFFICNPVSFAQQDFQEEDLEKGLEAYNNYDFEKALTFLSPLEQFIEELDEDSKSIVATILGQCYRQVDKLEKARIMFEIVQNTSPSNHDYIFQAKLDLLSIYTELGDLASAAVIAEDLLGIFNKNGFQKSGYYSLYANALCSYYMDTYEYNRVLDISKKGLNVVDSEDMAEGLRGVQKNTLYQYSGTANFRLQNYEQAVIDYKNALSYISYTGQDIGDLISAIGNVFAYANLPDSALVYYEDAEKKYSLQNSPINIQKAKNSLGLSIALISNGENLKAQPYLLTAEYRFKQLGDSIYLPYVYSLLYNNSTSIGDKELSLKYANLIKELFKSTKMDNSYIYYNYCNSTFASILGADGKFEEAICLMENIIDDSFNSDISINIATGSLYNLAILFYSNSKFVPSEVAIKKALELIEPYKELYNETYIDYQILLTNILNVTNRMGEAISNLENLREFVEKTDVNNNTKSLYYHTLSSLYSNFGNYDKNLDYIIHYSETQLINKGAESYAYALSLINLSDAYGLSDQEDKSVECLNSASQIIKKLYGEESKEYYPITHKKALVFAFDSIRTSEGDRAFTGCLSLSKQLYGENSPEYAEDLCWYGIYLLYSSKDKQGLDMIQNGLSIISSYKGFDNKTLSLLGQLSTWCHYFKEYDLAFGIDQTYYNELKNYLSENLLKLVDWQRESLWTSIRSAIPGIISSASETNSPKYLKLAYNLILLGKGLLLQSSNHISNAVKHSDDPELIDIHNRLQIEKNRLLNASDLDEIETIRLNIYSLQRMELNRIDQSKVLFDMFDIEWTDVRDNLEDGEVAIEFMSLPSQDCNSYGALVLNEHSREPLFIPLFNDKELERYVKNSNVVYDYEDPDFYRFIWDRLETYGINEAQKVYFAPDGALHKIAIESLVDTNGRFASDKWELYRLTSTREIVRRRTDNSYKFAALFGGLKYTMEADNLAEVAQLRAGVKYLAETRFEIEDIQEMLEAHSIRCKVKTGEMGTEESFLSLSSTGMNIIHLATHGFFWKDNNQNAYSNVRFKSLIENSDFGESALLRAGLMFSGANLALQGENLPMGIEDGILTAHEISSLDFEDLDLVVLSACQTAQGEVSGEGVFGLQRGFKLAGVHTLLMSLWNVDDYSTRLLMTDFYKHLLLGESKIDALHNAQKTVRSTNGYESPKYWAGFILLDGI